MSADKDEFEDNEDDEENAPEDEEQEGNILPILFLRSGYELLIPQFYKSGGKERVENFARRVESEHNLELRTINWDDKIGLKSIRLSVNCAYDFNENTKRFMFHNIETYEFMKPLHRIAKYYIEELETIKIDKEKNKI